MGVLVYNYIEKWRKQMKIKSQRGSLTMYVLISMIIITTIAVGYFVASANKQQTQVEAIEQMKKIYASNTTI